MNQIEKTKFRPSLTLKHRTPRGGKQCDFCGSSSVNKLFPCANFKWNGFFIFSTPSGYWTGCPTCGDLVESEQWSKLVTRVMAEVKKRRELKMLEPSTLRAELAQLQKDLARLHKLFAANRGSTQAIEVIERERGA